MDSANWAFTNNREIQVKLSDLENLPLCQPSMVWCTDDDAKNWNTVQQAAADKQGLPALPLLLLWIWNETIDVSYRPARNSIHIYIISPWDTFFPPLYLHPKVCADLVLQQHKVNGSKESSPLYFGI